MKLSDYINETNLSRVFQHLNEPDRCMIAISALRDEIKDTKERKFLTKQLQFDIKAGGFGFSKVTGAFIENKDTPFEKEVYEDSFLVFFKSSELEKAKKYFGALCRKYNQDAYLLVVNGEAYFINKHDKKDKLGKWHPNQFDVYFTKLKNGRKFSFESTTIENDFRLTNGLSPSGHRIADFRQKALEKAVNENISYEEAIYGKNIDLNKELIDYIKEYPDMIF